MAVLLAGQLRTQRRRLALAAFAGALVAAAAVILLGLSGWFIAGAAVAGGAGAAVAQGFNYLTPSAVIRLLAILRTGARYVERVSGHDAALQALARLRPEIFASFAKGRPGAVLAVAAGDASSRLVQDVDALQTLFVRLSGPWAAGAGALTAVALAGLADRSAAAVVVVFMVAMVGLNRLIGERLASPAGAEIQRAGGAFRARLGALEAAAPELKAYGLTAWGVAEVAAAAAPLDRATARLNGAGGWMAAVQAVLTGLALVVVILAAHNAPTPLVALAALSAVTGIEAAAALSAAFRQGGGAREAIDRLDALMPEPARSSGGRPHDISLTVEATGDVLRPPERLAIIGPSGSGKTTLIERLVGLRETTTGDWQVGGTRLRDLAPGAVLPLLSYAAQDVRLLDGSVRENLLLAAPDATDEALWAALEDAAVADRVRSSAEGLDMPVGTNGSRLSGGERRRLGLARAYLRPAPWLVLDEPTEGLDACTEARVLRRLDRRLRDRGQGLVLISHRPAPVAICDRTVNVRGVTGTGPVRLRGVDPAAVAATDS